MMHLFIQCVQFPGVIFAYCVSLSSFISMLAARSVCLRWLPIHFALFCAYLFKENFFASAVVHIFLQGLSDCKGKLDTVGQCGFSPLCYCFHPHFPCLGKVGCQCSSSFVLWWNLSHLLFYKPRSIMTSCRTFPRVACSSWRETQLLTM